MVPLLLLSARQWKDFSPEQAQCPLRIYLIQAIVAELHQRFCKFKVQLENQKIRIHAIIQTKLITEDNAFPFHRWNGATDLNGGNGTLCEVSPLAAPNSQGEVVPWRLQIPLRNDDLLAHLKGLTQSSIWMVLASRLKVHGTQRFRSRPAQELQMMHMPAKRLVESISI